MILWVYNVIKKASCEAFIYGGERGIRTLEQFNPLHAFQACSFSLSDTSPMYRFKARRIYKLAIQRNLNQSNVDQVINKVVFLSIKAIRYSLLATLIDENYSMDINLLLRLMAEKNASDLFFSTGAPPHMKIEGISTPMGQSPLPAGAIKDIAYNMMSEAQIKEFEEEWESNFAHTVNKVGRFRVNVFKQRGEVGMVLRHIKYQIPTIEELKLPAVISKMVMEVSGLILICGPTGSGKSTTMAGMIDYRNSRSAGHILTIEDPIEFLHRHKMSILDQREIGVDTKDYHNALKNAMREAPDVIMIGEIRDTEAMKYALSFAQTGHLVIATIHGNNVKQALDRVRNMFPADSRDQVMLELSTSLKGVVSQRLLRNQKGVRVPAIEIMGASPETAEIIAKGRLDDLRKIIESSEDDGMQTFDHALYTLWKQKEITREDALHFAESRTDLSLKMRLGNQSGNPSDVMGSTATPEQGRFTSKF